jgi:hypothetical protein
MLPGVAQLELTPAALAINAVALLPSYVATYFWPIDLNMYHDFDAVGSVREPAFVAGVGISLLWLGLTLACSRRHRGAAFGLAFAAVAVAPYLLARWPQLNVYAERYTYLPSVGLLLATADAVAPRLRGSRASAAVVVALLICFVVLDRQRTTEWHDEVSIYEKTLTQSPRAELIRNNLALRYLSLGTPERGIPLQQRLLEIDPDFRSGWHNLGLLYRRCITSRAMPHRGSTSATYATPPGNVSLQSTPTSERRSSIHSKPKRYITSLSSRWRWASPRMLRSRYGNCSHSMPTMKHLRNCSQQPNPQPLTNPPRPWCAHSDDN